jgi:hypothetical protein
MGHYLIVVLQERGGAGETHSLTLPLQEFDSLGLGLEYRSNLVAVAEPNIDLAGIAQVRR